MSLWTLHHVCGFEWITQFSKHLGLALKYKYDSAGSLEIYNPNNITANHNSLVNLLFMSTQLRQYSSQYFKELEKNFVHSILCH